LLENNSWSDDTGDYDYDGDDGADVDVDVDFKYCTLN